MVTTPAATPSPSLELQTEFWNHWNTEAREHQPLDPASLQRASFVLERLPQLLAAGTRPAILDVGCGTGWLSGQLSALGDVTGIDLADAVIARARERVPAATFVAGDFLHADFAPASFDVVVSLETIAHVIDQAAFMRRVHDLLRPGGVLLLTTQNRFAMERMNTMRQQPGQLRDWLTRGRLRRLAAPHFEIVELTTIVPAVGRGVLRIAGSYKVNRVARLLASEATLDRVKGRLGLGQTIVLAARKAATPQRFVLISPCGHGNLGDAAIQDTAIGALRARFGNPHIVAATLNPHDTEQRHGVPSVPLIGISRPGYDTPPAAAPTTAHHAVVPPRSLATSVATGVARLLLPKGWPWLLKTEAAHVRTVWRTLRGTRALVVSGGGQLDEFWGGPWGHPYTLFKWALLARLRGARVVVLSVGVGTLRSRVARRFARWALRLAHFRSFRDSGSSTLVRNIGFNGGDSVSPDLAYGTVAAAAVREPRPSRSRLTVGISPMIFCDPRSWPRKDAAAYRGYLERLAEATDWLVRRGHRVVVFTSDAPDDVAARDLTALLEKDARVIDTRSVAAFLEAAATTDVLVASRLHGVLLGHVAGTPALALSYDRKVTALMAEMRHQHLCLDIERFDLAAFQSAFAEVEAHLPELRRSVTEQVARNRDELRAHFDRAFA